MTRAPSIQWYYKQWLGDDTVLGMDWEATGMHHHLLMISIQQEPPGSLPNDMALIRRWLRSPSDDVWRRVQPQVFSAWTLRGDRWFNSGMVDTMERQRHYRERYETGTKKHANPIKTVIEDKDSIHSKNLDQNQQRQVFVESEAQAPSGFGSSVLAIGLLGNLQMVASPHVVGVVQSAIEIASKAKKISLEEACDWHLQQARKHISQGRVVDRFYFEGGMRRWESDGKRNEVSKGAERTNRNRENITEAFKRRYGLEDAGSGSVDNGLQRPEPGGNKPLAKVLGALPGRTD